MEFGTAKNSAGTASRGKRIKVGTLRRSHLLLTYGPGAIVDLPEYTVIMGACDYWDYPRVIHEARLERMLGVKCFKEPAISEDAFTSDGVVRAMRFPYWHYCSKCGNLGPYWVIGSGKNATKCASPTCNGDLIPSRFVAVCEGGHIQDFPYEFWVHGNSYCKKKGNKKNPRMKVEFSAQSSGLEAIRITCQECGATRTLANCTAPSQLNPHYCRGFRPWVGNRPSDNDPNGCGRELRVVQRGAANVYYPVNASALTIPGYRSKVLDTNYNQIDKIVKRTNGNVDMAKMVLSVSFGDELADEGMTVDDLLSEYEAVNNKSSVAIRTRDILEGEYRAMSAPDTDDPDFKTSHVDVPPELIGLLSDVVLVRRLKEVMALKGFTRLNPEGEYDEDADGPEVMPPFANQQDWLPAMELRGEGIFIKIDFDALEQWSDEVGSRYRLMGERLAASRIMKCSNFSPEFVMLHTLAHIFIRQLTNDCGYSGSSLKERIYSSWPESDKKMAGILIYTSASDSDGSLGGLVRQGRPDRLLTTMKSALSAASWCSSDPICSESTDQGFESLNYAACHACTLLPETSCAMRNCLLDRVAVVGTLDHPELGFFGQWMVERSK